MEQEEGFWWETKRKAKSKGRGNPAALSVFSEKAIKRKQRMWEPKETGWSRKKGKKFKRTECRLVNKQGDLHKLCANPICLCRAEGDSVKSLREM